MTDVRTGAGTGPAPQDTSPQDTGPRTSPQRAWRPWIRRHRALAGLAAIVVAAMCLVVWNQLAPKGNDTPLSAGNAGPDGARAVTRILARHGVNVHEADTFVLYITRFQILPEERALIGIFGQEYEEYRRRTRRWL